MCKTFKVFKEKEAGFIATEESVNSAILSAEKQLFSYVTPESKSDGMATTYNALFRAMGHWWPMQAIAGYTQVRDGKIIKTSDRRLLMNWWQQVILMKKMQKTIPKKM